MIVTYLKQPNGKWDEVTEFKKHYRTKHLQSAAVILDLKEKCCIKNSLNSEADFDDMLEFYKKLLGTKLTPYLEAFS